MYKLVLALLACVLGVVLSSPPSLYGSYGSYGRSYGYDFRSPYSYSYSSYNLHPSSYYSSYSYPNYDHYGLDYDYDYPSYGYGHYGRGYGSGIGGYYGYGHRSYYDSPYYLRK